VPAIEILRLYNWAVTPNCSDIFNLLLKGDFGDYETGYLLALWGIFWGYVGLV
jgi:hypothetical protein